MNLKVRRAEVKRVAKRVARFERIELIRAQSHASLLSTLSTREVWLGVLFLGCVYLISCIGVVEVGPGYVV